VILDAVFAVLEDVYEAIGHGSCGGGGWLGRLQQRQQSVQMLRHRLASLSVTLGVSAVAAAAWSAAAAAQHQPPIFRSASEVVVIETTAVGRNGDPITDLGAADFDVRFNGQRRTVISADFVTTAAPDSAGPDRQAGAMGSNGRVIVVAVDEHSIPAGAQPAVREAVSRITERVQAADAVALVTFPGGVAVGPTRDHGQITDAISRVGGRRVDVPRVRFNLAASEAISLKSRESMSAAEIINRECQREFTNPTCADEVRQSGGLIADAIERQGLSTIDALHGLLDSLQGVSGRKVVFVVSAGLPTTTVPGGRPNLTAATEAMARRAAAADIQLYVFYLNIRFMEHFSAATGWRSPSSLYQDINLFGSGLQRFADTAGGAFFQVEVDSDPFVDRAFREVSAWYRLAVRPEPSDSDGKPRQVRLTTRRGGTTLRYRQVVTIPRASASLSGDGEASRAQKKPRG